MCGLESVVIFKLGTSEVNMKGEWKLRDGFLTLFRAIYTGCLVGVMFHV